jgi:hypothetical protein
VLHTCYLTHCTVLWGFALSCSVLHYAPLALHHTTLYLHTTALDFTSLLRADCTVVPHLLAGAQVALVHTPLLGTAGISVDIVHINALMGYGPRCCAVHCTALHWCVQCGGRRRSAAQYSPNVV